ncbi:hypothetical protein RHMOL_Rhmol04G0166200 [Rhododendron molle]|uniref:Uncharacterized protein n=1 Tax=Rhododendron molle TaxID=49168 RepID=A0ACC0P2F5_RHOML|nr:hypothetical protein RHMOL_Rhmol04G0166200 [Rhododendron molle]
MRSEESFTLFSPMKDSNDEYEDTEIAEKSPNGRYIRYKQVLGREFGATSKIAYKGFDVGDGMEVTWNKLRVNDLSKAAEQVEERLNTLLKPLRHKNIIKSYSTWVDHETGSINVITESFTSGNLREFRKKHRSVDIVAIKNWARQILQGLCYLHTHDPPIIHGDLTCGNIFVNGNTGEVKIGGLGLKEEENDPSVDLYAFGICMLELVSSASECLKIEEGHKGNKVDTRILLEEVKDIQVRQFIEKCLVPASYIMGSSSVEELLKHPFLEKNRTSLAMDMVKEADSHPVSVMEFKVLNERNEFRLTGERRDGNSASLVLRIADLCGQGRVTNIEFEFCVDTDTTISVAGEMVQELGLPLEDVTLIVELMDNLIIKLVPCWMPSFGRFNGVKRSYVDPIFGF